MPRTILFTLVLAAPLFIMATPVLPAEPGAPEFADTLEQRLIACSACHGKQGEGSRRNEYYPRIAGKPAEYLYRQLVNFRDGKRTYPQMVYFSRHLSDEYLMGDRDVLREASTTVPNAHPAVRDQGSARAR